VSLGILGMNAIVGASHLLAARAAEAVPGAKIKRLAFPDAPPPGAPEMLNYMRVDAAKIAAAARKMLRA